VTLLEVCLEDIDGAVTAERCGADRIELCAGLIEGGITPSIGTVRTVLRSVDRIGVQVLVRQRGGDFVYSAAEIDAMCADIEAMRGLSMPQGVRLGFVIGALNGDDTVDRVATQRMRSACGDAPVTFHKAFDLTPDLEASLDSLIEMGIGRVLTSGGEATAVEGAESLTRLVEHAAGRIAILAAGGVRPHNAAALIARTGVEEVHFRAVAPIADGRRHGAAADGDTAVRLATSAAVIDDMLEVIAR
jgi:copper homeostasis protein